jgi:hypothetical protein
MAMMNDAWLMWAGRLQAGQEGIDGDVPVIGVEERIARHPGILLQRRLQPLGRRGVQFERLIVEGEICSLGILLRRASDLLKISPIADRQQWRLHIDVLLME